MPSSSPLVSVQPNEAFIASPLGHFTILLDGAIARRLHRDHRKFLHLQSSKDAMDLGRSAR
jgi:hypothetical protein